MTIISITVEKRFSEVPDVQSILTKYGKGIVSRLGLHNFDENKKGLILVVYSGDDIENFIEELNNIEGTNVNHMEAD